MAAIQKRLPDLILMSALVPPRDEAELNDHLRGVAGAEHIRKRKRTPPRRFRAGQRPPEPLSIVSKRMLELG